MLEKVLQWDKETFIYLNSLGLVEYDLFWSIITNIYTWIPLFICFFVMLFWKFPRKQAVYMALTLVLLIGFVLLATDLTKNFFERLRPNNDEEVNSLIRILKNPTSFSFFSGHASTSFSITTLLVLFLRKNMKWVWILYLWPIIFALSRIYVGVHYPIDIIVGAVVGLLSALLFYKIHSRFIIPYLKLDRP